MRTNRAIVVCLLLLSTMSVAAEPTSEDNAQLKKWLKQFPAADANRDGVLTFSEAKQFQKERRNRAGTKNNRTPVPKPTHADVKYGEHQLQAFDIWLAESEEPTPVVLYIHGGGFRGGDKRGVNASFLEQCLDSGCSFASINYRMIPEIQFPVPMHDSARALQLIRHRAEQWNLDPTRIASTGGSAGGGISLWLALHDDLADLESDDPIAQQSTRLTCAAVSGAQSSYDYRFTDKIGLPGFTRHSSAHALFGVETEQDLESPGVIRMMEEMSPINHVSKDDPPILMDYGIRNVDVDNNTSVNAIVHHPKLGIALQEVMSNCGLHCVVQYPGAETQQRVSQFDFIQQHFKQ